MRPGGPAQYGGGQLPMGPGAGSPQQQPGAPGGWAPPPSVDLVRCGVSPTQLDSRALPKLSLEQAKLLRAPPAGARGAPLQMTFSAVADCASLQAQLGAAAPLGAIAQPLATEAPPTVRPADDYTPVLCRCKKCSAYLNAYAGVDMRSMR